jgi:hypothetical protein
MTFTHEFSAAIYRLTNITEGEMADTKCTPLAYDGLLECRWTNPKDHVDVTLQVRPGGHDVESGVFTRIIIEGMDAETKPGALAEKLTESITRLTNRMGWHTA